MAASPPSAPTKPTLIHLQNSSSQSALWVLEELEIDYDLRLFPRPQGRAPPELKETHPQGKSPQLLLPSGRVITQLSAIVLYLIRTYDTSHTFSSPENDPVREEMLLGIGGTDLASKLGSKLMLHGVALLSPFFIRPLLNRVRKFLNELVLDPDIAACFDVLESELGAQEWFMGGTAPSRVDFVVHFFVGLAVQPGYVHLEKYKGLKAWMERCEARPAWKRALERGNGYDLDYPRQWA
ncbi:hypothetical protein QBC47DRAFT_394654 [Echria macrotheca]|uniref:Glutathione S-transferase n=1 Tax=Echria macrotheca TaxID=438768 RepID=A0AAJ0B2R3_9PEZI|nr:hypothetical protein QBC47DRAFT_394654 [Echria macrotheca]